MMTEEIVMFRCSDNMYYIVHRLDSNHPPKKREESTSPLVLDLVRTHN